jgi:hypothetical protein
MILKVLAWTAAVLAASVQGVCAGPVTVPPGYKGDYCTKSPDSFTRFFWCKEGLIPNAKKFSTSFKGPCARHDLCYDRLGRGNASCDSEFLANLQSQCNWEFGNLCNGKPKAACFKVDQIYYEVVKVAN